MAAGVNGTVKDTGVVSEMIGRYIVGDVQFSVYRNRASINTVDQTIPDYAFWDSLRRGKAKGYSLGSLFAKRIERVFASWVLGSGIEVMLHDPKKNKKKSSKSDDNETINAVEVDISDDRREYTNAQLADFIHSLLDAGQDDENEQEPDRDDRQASILLSVFRDTLGLGDQYIIVNADGSLSVPSPDTVTVVRDELDYRHILAVRVENRLEGITIIDEYRADGRTVTIKKGAEVIRTEQFANLIGRIPVVHVAHDMSGNETYGHPIHEELRPLYDEYDDLLYKQLDGAKLLGNPIPTVSGLKDINAVKNANDPATPETYIDRDGNEVTRPLINMDRNALMLLGEGGDFKFVAPPVGFTEDTKTALKSLFLLLLDYTGIPEGMWGGELSSARATSDTQMTQFVRDIEGWQKDAGGWIIKLCKIWLQVRAVVDPRIVVAKLDIKWPPVLSEDEEMRLKQLEFAKKYDLLTDETALKLLALVDNAEQEVQEAEEEADERREQMQVQMAAQQAQQANTNGQQAPVTEMVYSQAEATALVNAASRIVSRGERVNGASA